MESSENAGKRGFNEQMHSTLLKGLIQGANIEAARQLFDILKSRYPRSAWLNTNMMVGELTLGNVKLEKISSIITSKKSEMNQLFGIHLFIIY